MTQPFDPAARARGIVAQWASDPHYVARLNGRAQENLENAIAAALTAVRDEERENCAKIVEAQAHVEASADDTMAGWHRGQPYRNLAAAIRHQEEA